MRLHCIYTAWPLMGVLLAERVESRVDIADVDHDLFCAVLQFIYIAQG